MSLSDVVGHARALRVLARTLQAGRTPHAYLFWGPDGVGKERVAQETAGILLCAGPRAREDAEPCGVCPSCRKLAAGSHPDLHRVAAKGASISVDDIRRLQETLSYQAFERGSKVAIIRDAFRMTREAANALLKTLEEPPLGTHLFLLAHHRNQLLPTLVSRCQALRFDPLSQAEVARLLEARGVDPSVARKLAEVSGGAPGAALAEEPGELVALLEEADAVCAALTRAATAERFAASARWAGDKERLGRRLDCLEGRLRERVVRSAEAGDAEEEALDFLSGVVQVRRLLDQNVNVQLALDAFFLGLLGETLEGSP